MYEGRIAGLVDAGEATVARIGLLMSGGDRSDPGDRKSDPGDRKSDPGEGRPC